MITQTSEQEKFLAAKRSVELVKDGMRVGLGTGSTAAYAVKCLGERVREGLNIRCVCTSIKTEQLARAESIPIFNLAEIPELDIAIDGADEVDSQLHLVKGGGGALLREKVVASCASKFVVIVEGRKLVKNLGVFGLPIEVVPFAAAIVVPRLLKLGARSAALRLKDDGTEFFTDQNNNIIDCHFGSITNPANLAEQIDSIVGIVEHGLFISMTDMVIAANGEQIIVLEPQSIKAT
ncbi:MAG: ribose 5-phosphate isomerase A [Cyanobacteria bacterium DS3.002]|nr:ribose 5-phosphate isomerase A [Cyanobacteria bacterium DS3.002]